MQCLYCNCKVSLSETFVQGNEHTAQMRSVLVNCNVCGWVNSRSEIIPTRESMDHAMRVRNGVLRIVHPTIHVPDYILVGDNEDERQMFANMFYLKCGDLAKQMSLETVDVNEEQFSSTPMFALLNTGTMWVCNAPAWELLELVFQIKQEEDNAQQQG